MAKVNSSKAPDVSGQVPTPPEPYMDKVQQNEKNPNMKDSCNEQYVGKKK